MNQHSEPLPTEGTETRGAPLAASGCMYPPHEYAELAALRAENQYLRETCAQIARFRDPTVYGGGVSHALNCAVALAERALAGKDEPC